MTKAQFHPNGKEYLLLVSTNNRLNRTPKLFGTDSIDRHVYPYGMALIDPDSLSGDAPVSANPITSATNRGTELWYGIFPMTAPDHPTDIVNLPVDDSHGSGSRNIVALIRDGRIYEIGSTGAQINALYADNWNGTVDAPPAGFVRLAKK